MNKPVKALAQIVADAKTLRRPASLTRSSARPIQVRMTSGPLLKATKLGAMRGDRVLFRDVSLELGTGEAMLLRGDNGTGKTTLLRLLSGLAAPESGHCEAEPHHWVGHRTGLKPHETPRSHLHLWATAWGAEADIDTILNKMALRRAADVPASGLSAGQCRRTALARTQLVRRDLWILDEPFAALDAAGKALICELIASHRASGGAVIAAVHGDVSIPNTLEVRL